MEQFEKALEFEQRFWIAVLRDHSQFILDSLSPKEKKEIKRAKHFLHLFEQLDSAEGLKDLTTSYESAIELRKFKLHLLRRLLTEKFDFHLTPTFINHMVNEVEEYLRILPYLMDGKEPPTLHPLHHHLLWLPDASGHAVGIRSNLDGTEKDLFEKSQYFGNQFEDFYIKAIELAGYLRTHLSEFPALSRFNKQVELEINLFMNFLHEIEELGLSKEMLSTLNPLLANHMYREECYYLTKLAQVSEVEDPKCSPIRKMD
ncbi:DUF2935 domain-containing protein [Risungbinella massiliensis]|uniref:DUF2935 domain-containing protein n=1 Tax=Risungbinella massiliensis TaxID=1329796 RepID=UPI0005CC5E47|nr:DUF2935 domain-containing protein [Risungbinella massiliensis]